MVFTAVEVMEAGNGGAVVGLVAVGVVGFFVAMLVTGFLMFLSWAVKRSGRRHSRGGLGCLAQAVRHPRPRPG